MRHVKVGGVFDGLAEVLQRTPAFVRHYPERGREVRMLDSVTLKLRVLEPCEAVRLSPGLEKGALPFSRFAVPHHELKVWPFGVIIFSNSNFSVSHEATMLAYC